MPNRLPNSDASNCADFAAILQSVFDGDRVPAELDSSHLLACDSCRELASAAKLLLAGLPSLAEPVDTPIDFASRVVPSVLAERMRGRAGRRTVVAMAASLAASVLVLVAASRPWDSPDRGIVKVELPDRPSGPVPPPVESSFRQAGAAFASLTVRTAEESIAPARNLFSSLELTAPSPPRVPVPSHPTRSTVEPLTNTAKRAINLFIRDVGGLAPSSQMKS